MSDKIKFVKIGNITFVGFEKESDTEEALNALTGPPMPPGGPVSDGVQKVLSTGTIPSGVDPAMGAAMNKPSAPPVRRMPAGHPMMQNANKKLHRPRILIVDHDNNNISLAKCIGNPETLTVGVQMEFSYYNEDPEFEKFFLGETTAIPGLTLVK